MFAKVYSNQLHKRIIKPFLKRETMCLQSVFNDLHLQEEPEGLDLSATDRLEKSNPGTGQKPTVTLSVKDMSIMHLYKSL